VRRSMVHTMQLMMIPQTARINLYYRLLIRFGSNVPAFYLLKNKFGENGTCLERTKVSNDKIKSVGFIFKWEKLEDAISPVFKKIYLVPQLNSHLTFFAILS
jgi:hypothetical protein